MAPHCQQAQPKSEGERGSEESKGSDGPFPSSEPRGAGVKAHPHPKEASAFRTWRSRLAWLLPYSFCPNQYISTFYSLHTLFIPLFFPLFLQLINPPLPHWQNHAHFQQPLTGPTTPTLAAHLSVLLCASPYQPFSSKADLLGTGMVIFSGCCLVNV